MFKKFSLHMLKTILEKSYNLHYIIYILNIN